MKSSNITIAVIDDSLKWSKIAESHINKIEGYSLLVKQQDGFNFINWCYHHKQLPDIAIVDIEMPKMDGVQLTDFLTEHFPSIKTIAISSYCHIEAIEDMISGGAWGYVSKLYDMKNLPQAIIEVAKGILYIDPILQIKEISREHLMKTRENQKEQLDKLNLSFKQKEIISLYTTSASQKEIANALSLSTKTIENRVKNVSEILHVNNRQEFTIESLRRGFTRLARIFKSLD